MKSKVKAGIYIMTSHSRLSPGVEIHEIDRSQYEKTDYSITGTTVFMCGFADKGENYTPQWVNTLNTFTELYGEPTNEVEMYLYSGVREVLDNGGVCIVSKLPYDNQSKDRFTICKYKVEDCLLSSGTYAEAISSIDPSLTACLSVSRTAEGDGLVTLDELDRYRTGAANISRNEIVIADITRCNYGKIDLRCQSGNSVSNDVECLGVMPVIVTPANAMFYQGLLSSFTSCDETGEYTFGLSDYQPVADAANLSGVTLNRFDAQNFSRALSADQIDDDCVSKAAVDQFPAITYNLSSTVDRSYAKHIGVAVFRAVKDQANDNKLSFELAEFFTGSLDKLSRNPETGASDYIGNIINSGSKYINFFSNVPRDARYMNAQTIVTCRQTAPILGFFESQRAKHMSYKESIIDPLNAILDRACDPNQVRIDVVADAGVSNLAAFAAYTQDLDKTASDTTDKYNAETYPALPDGTTWGFQQALAAIGRWHAVLRKFDSFCKGVRRDCMFVADIFRPVVLDGDEKAVRNTNIRNTIENTIVARLRHVTGLDSSWSAGYSNWFYAPYGDTGDFFWCPPSIKAAGIYLYSDVYFHAWDAPAGLTRGVVRNVYDVSYNPRSDEAGRIYQQAWNYAVSYPVEGIVMEGQKTFQLNKTALDRVNVRRLMIWLEKRITAVARRFLYEGNTSYMRQRFVDAVEPILEEAKNGYGIVDYALRCDDTLNTAQVIDNNELRCVIAVKPVKTIEWIRIGMICTNQSASVTEEVMK